LASWVLGLVDEGHIEGEKGVDVIVGGGGGDDAGVLSSVASVGLSLFDGDDQVGEQGGFSADSFRRRGCRSNGTFVDSDCGGSVWWGRRVDSNGGDSSGGSGWWRRRGRSDRDGRSRNVWFLGDTDVVFADSFPRVSAIAVRILHAAHWWRGRRKSSGGGTGGD